MEFGVPNKLLGSYLTNKKQFASINGIKSTILNVKHGTTQASILGLLLYEIYLMTSQMLYFVNLDFM